MRLHITVDGATEERFVKRTLAPYLGLRKVYADARGNLTSTDNKTNYEYRGGIRRHKAYDAIKKDIISWIKKDNNPECRFTTMFDFYALPKDFPKYDEAMGIQNKYERVVFLENALADNILKEITGYINNICFIPYIQLHEFEALILADPQRLDCEYLEHDKAIKNIIAMVEKEGGNPELINDRYDKCPSRRIIKEIPEYEGDKKAVGPLVAEEIGIDKMRNKCRHFNDWLTRLVALAGVPP
ncbi:MAG: DUF4276 family protein [Nitrospirae bacterium]|nr:DUF4276 family protein [Nitrospirota bacterium]